MHFIQRAIWSFFILFLSTLPSFCAKAFRSTHRFYRQPITGMAFELYVRLHSVCFPFVATSVTLLHSARHTRSVYSRIFLGRPYLLSVSSCWCPSSTSSHHFTQLKKFPISFFYMYSFMFISSFPQHFITNIPVSQNCCLVLMCNTL